MTTTFSRAETIHRLAKQAIDSGAAKTLAEAEAMLQGYRLGFKVGPNEAGFPEHQSALLTGVALARRVFLGGVHVEGVLDVPLRSPMPLGRTLAGAVCALGGTVGLVGDDTPQITVGGGPQPRREGFHVRTACAGWRGGIVPAHADLAPSGGRAMPLSAMLAAALAVNEAFTYVSSKTAAAGRRAQGLSLWSPGSKSDWLVQEADEPELAYLPSRLWLIGLGHLGQAFLWGLSLLEYVDPSGVELVLQDIDVITPSTESTSVLSDASLLGQKKTRAMATWAERRGFATSIHERLFDASFRRQSSEPAVALCGLDNAVGRRALDQVGFDLVVEAGLGRGHRDFRTIRLHTLPGARSAADIWKTTAAAGEDLRERAAYQKLLNDGELDRCGVTLLAGKAVGAPFVGAVVASLALAEILRLLHGGPVHQLVDLDLKSVDHRAAIVHPGDFTRMNPGYIASAA